MTVTAITSMSPLAASQIKPFVSAAVRCTRELLAWDQPADTIHAELVEELRILLDERTSSTRRFDLLHRDARRQIVEAVRVELARRYGLAVALDADELVSPAEDADLIRLGFSPRQRRATHPERPVGMVGDEELVAFRDRVRWEEGLDGGGCHEVSPALAHHYGGATDEMGYFLLALAGLPDGGRGYAIHHYWNRLDDGTIIDVTFDQFGLGAKIGRFAQNDPMQDCYVPAARGCASGWICEDAVSRNATGQLVVARCCSCETTPSLALGRALAAELNRREQREC